MDEFSSHPEMSEMSLAAVALQCKENQGDGEPASEELPSTALVSGCTVGKLLGATAPLTAPRLQSPLPSPAGLRPGLQRVHTRLRRQHPQRRERRSGVLGTDTGREEGTEGGKEP